MSIVLKKCVVRSLLSAATLFWTLQHFSLCSSVPLTVLPLCSQFQLHVPRLFFPCMCCCLFCLILLDVSLQL